MSKEELEQEAENFAYGMGYDTYESDGHSDFAVRDILVKFAEPREKRIAELEAQIEKMKCLLNEIYSEYGFNELVKIRNDLPLEIQELLRR